MPALYHDCDGEGNTLVMADGALITPVTKIEETSLGGRLRAARADAGLSQEALATKAGLASQAAVSMIEKGTRGKELPAETLFSLAKALGVRPLWLLYGRGSMKDEALPLGPGGAFIARYSAVGLELLHLFERIQDEDMKERLYARFQAQINAALQGLPTELSEYEPWERDAAPTPAPPAQSQKQPGKRRDDSSEGSTPSPVASRRRGR
jgi:transcriptional regulator with XRE-family HTH domain